MKKELRGELSIIISQVLFAVAAVFVKFASDEFSGFFISLARFTIGIILGVSLLLIIKKSLRVYDKRLWLLRGFYGSVSMVLYYLSIQMTSSGRASLLNLTYPVFVALFGYLVFKERIKAGNVAGIILCIIGIFLVYYDGSHYSFLGNTLGLMSGISAGMAIHYLRKSGEKNHPIMVYMAPCIFGIIFSSFSAGQAASLSLHSGAILAVAGLAAFCAQISITYGFQNIEATKGSVISFIGVPLTILCSYLFVGEVIKLKFLIGTAIILAGLFINRKTG